MVCSQRIENRLSNEVVESQPIVRQAYIWATGQPGHVGCCIATGARLFEQPHIRGPRKRGDAERKEVTRGRRRVDDSRQRRLVERNSRRGEPFDWLTALLRIDVERKDERMSKATRVELLDVGLAKTAARQELTGIREAKGREFPLSEQGRPAGIGHPRGAERAAARHEERDVGRQDGGKAAREPAPLGLGVADVIEDHEGALTGCWERVVSGVGERADVELEYRFARPPGMTRGRPQELRLADAPRAKDVENPGWSGAVEHRCDDGELGPTAHETGGASTFEVVGEEQRRAVVRRAPNRCFVVEGGDTEAGTLGIRCARLGHGCPVGAGHRKPCRPASGTMRSRSAFSCCHRGPVSRRSGLLSIASHRNTGGTRAPVVPDKEGVMKGETKWSIHGLATVAAIWLVGGVDPAYAEPACSKDAVRQMQQGLDAIDKALAVRRGGDDWGDYRDHWKGVADGWDYYWSIASRNGEGAVKRCMEKDGGLHERLAELARIGKERLERVMAVLEEDCAGYIDAVIAETTRRVDAGKAAGRPDDGRQAIGELRTRFGMKESDAAAQAEIVTSCGSRVSAVAEVLAMLPRWKSELEGGEAIATADQYIKAELDRAARAVEKKRWMEAARSLLEAKRRCEEVASRVGTAPCQTRVVEWETQAQEHRRMAWSSERCPAGTKAAALPIKKVWLETFGADYELKVLRLEDAPVTEAGIGTTTEYQSVIGCYRVKTPAPGEPECEYHWVTFERTRAGRGPWSAWEHRSQKRGEKMLCENVK